MLTKTGRTRFYDRRRELILAASKSRLSDFKTAPNEPARTPVRISIWHFPRFRQQVVTSAVMESST